MDLNIYKAEMNICIFLVKVEMKNTPFVILIGVNYVGMVDVIRWNLIS